MITFVACSGRCEKNAQIDVKNSALVYADYVQTCSVQFRVPFHLEAGPSDL